MTVIINIINIISCIMTIIILLLVIIIICSSSSSSSSSMSSISSTPLLSFQAGPTPDARIQHFAALEERVVLGVRSSSTTIY